MISIVLLEDDNRFLSLIKKIIRSYGYTIDASFNTTSSFLNYIKNANKLPDIAILDLELPDKSGIEAIREIKHKLDRFSVLMLTSFDDENKVFEALREGASGYILKKDVVKKLKYALEDINQGGIVIEPILANKFLNYFKSFKTSSIKKIEISEEEKDILTFLVKGFTYGEIAGFLNKKTRNVKYILSKIYKKLNVTTKVEAISKAIRNGLVDI